MGYRLVITDDGRAPEAPLALETPSIAVSLLVAEINMGGGTAEIWDGDERVARMRRHCGSRQVFWELG